MTIQETITKAIEVGWQYNDPPHIEGRIPAEYEINHDTVFLDPLFWQSLGKAMGWGEEVATLSGGKKEECIFVGNKRHEAQWARAQKQPEWQYKWHRFIDHLADNKSAESFFEKL